MSKSKVYSPHEIELLRNFIYSYILGIFKPIKAKDIVYYAERNLGIDPRPYINSVPENIKMRARKVLAENAGLLEKWLRFDWLMSKVEQNRPDLSLILKNPVYRNWIERFINILKKALMKM